MTFGGYINQIKKVVMETYNRITHLININIISCLIPAIICLIIIEIFFKNRFKTKTTLKVFRYVIVVYTIFSSIPFLLGLIQYDVTEENHPLYRISGPFSHIYWIMIISSSILPYTLLIKKLSQRYWFVILIAFCINIGLYFERFIIIMTSLHRDGSPSENQISFIIEAITTLSIQGVIIAIVTLGLIEIISKRKSVQQGL